ncbi:hypothetical protein N9K24_06145 [Amylibacter sp.]|nr:hypothetical protein [Amylibacter sp.]MDB2472269.1 hypothetical protein [bacterium]MDB9991415.1 hypothetical protein [Amylibacter sp.]
MFRVLNLLMLSSTLAFFVTGPAMSQSLISSATWSKPISFDHCDSSGCKKYKSIELDRKSVEIGQSILIVKSDNGETISELTVTGIKYGNQIRMCWINNDENDPPSYIVVGGCKP